LVSGVSGVSGASVPALDLSWGSGADTPALTELLYAALDDFEPLAIQDHETADGWRIFFRTGAQRDAAADAVRGSLPLGMLDMVDIRNAEIADDDWARRSQANLAAVRVGRITVAPPWDIPATAVDLLIVIDPSTGFGTGHHETTRLCLRLMQSVDLKGRRTIDAGTGSGVLAIAAAKLGAEPVIAFDEDPEALRNARENIDRNRVSESVVVKERDLGSSGPSLSPACLVAANLTYGVLHKHADRLKAMVEPEGRLLMSGFPPGDVEALLRQFAARGDSQVVVEGEWAAVLVHKVHE
jgi:ribosomal protein L11 methyltransferase